MMRLLSIAAGVLGVTLGLLLITQSARADGLIIVDPPINPPPDYLILPYLPVKYHRVTVEIQDQVAQVEVDQAFINDSEVPLEATYVFPLPEDAAISEFSLFVDGERLEGRILDKEEAREIYESIVRRNRDPALLEYVGRNAFQAQVFPIPPHGERRVQISYTQLLSQEAGLVHFLYPLNTEKFSPTPLEEVAINVDVRSQTPIKAVYSPSHEVAIDRPSETHVTASYEETDVTPSTDFELFYSVSTEDIGASLTTYRQGTEDGFFLLLVAPKADFEEQEVVAKDVMLVLDVSGSMQGEKLEQAKDALRFVLERLNPADRFNILTFNSTIDTYAETMQSANRADEAYDFVDKLTADGSTNINEALLEALRLLPGERPELVIFLTDGQPTVGIQDPDVIIGNVSDAVSTSTRLFVFGVGDDVNTVLLDTLAQENRGAPQYVRPDEDIAAAVSSFYEKVSTPVLADIELDFGDIEVSDVYPNPLPDLFAGTQLVVVGRYEGEGTVTLRLTGTVNGEEQTLSYAGQEFPRRATEMDFLPRLWATRKIGYLLKEIRLHGENQELVDEVVDLSLRYGVMTPYTSFLVEEKNLEIFSDEGRRAAADRVAAPLAAAPTAGATAVKQSQAIQGYQEAEMPAPLESNVVEQLKVVGDRSFVLRDGVWIDSGYQEGMDTTKIGFGSDDYYDALAQRPDWGPFFALGERVIFLSDGQAYEVAEGDFPPVDVPDAPAQPDTPDEPPVQPDVPDEPPVQPDTPATSAPVEDGDGFPVVPVAVGLGVAVLLIATGAWYARRRWRRQ
jgi:Ca-activated chloride channel family protein